MKIFRKAADLRAYIATRKAAGSRIGYVPTMGALHAGHISLLQEAATQTDCTVCSIFVNPTQFNDPSDLAKYPKPIETDIQLLLETDCSVLYLPELTEIYPEPKPAPAIDYGTLTSLWEAFFRPGHFDGVVQVLRVLFDHVQADMAFFGLKDYQQCMVVQEMVKRLQLPIQLVFCPIIREADGLAMSSRNIRLSQEERIAATRISEALVSMQNCSEADFLSKLQAARAHIEANSCNRIEYFGAASVDYLTEMQPKSGETCVLLAAVFTGNVRLIDNLQITIQS